MSPALNLRSATVPSERRRYRRYPIQAGAEVFLFGAHLTAETIDISSGGVLLASRTLLPVGRRVQLSIDWPALLNERCGLRLMVEGKVLRSNENGSAVAILRYEYRTRSRAPLRREMAHA
jgi:hypothetical protein